MIRKIKVTRIILLSSFVFASMLAEAKDLGKMGSSFNIDEEPFLKMIERKLKSLDIEEHQKVIKEKAEKSVREPKIVKAIKRAKLDREWQYDPSFTTKKDIILPCGKLLHKAGTTINPLDNMEFDRVLYFIQGDDKDQVRWVSQSLQRYKKEEMERIKVILVSGKPLELEQHLSHKIYFDQFGELTKKFGIKNVPASVKQDGKYLEIKEIALE